MENVSEHQAVRAFKEGVWYRELTLKFGRSGAMTLNQMMEIATRYTNGEEEDRLLNVKERLQILTLESGIPVGSKNAKLKPLVRQEQRL